MMQEVMYNYGRISIGNLYIRLQTQKSTTSLPLWKTAGSRTPSTGRPKDIEPITPPPEYPSDETIEANIIDACLDIIRKQKLHPTTYKLLISTTPGTTHETKSAIKAALKTEGFCANFTPFDQYQIAVAEELIKAQYDPKYTRWLVIDVGKFAKAAAIETNNKTALTLALTDDTQISAAGPLIEIEDHLKEQFPLTSERQIQRVKKATLLLVNNLAQGYQPRESTTLLHFGDEDVTLTVERNLYNNTYIPWGMAILDLLDETTRQSGWDPNDVDMVLVTGAAAAHPLVLSMIQTSTPLAAIIPKSQTYVLQAMDTLRVIQLMKREPIFIPLIACSSNIQLACGTIRHTLISKGTPLPLQKRFTLRIKTAGEDPYIDLVSTTGDGKPENKIGRCTLTPLNFQQWNILMRMTPQRDTVVECLNTNQRWHFPASVNY